MTREELATFDGRDGRPAYVAVGGTIYDFTPSPLWRGGDHQGAHRAGCDLTEELRRAPHVRAVVERFPVVGELTASDASRGAGRRWGAVALLLALLAIVYWLSR